MTHSHEDSPDTGGWRRKTETASTAEEYDRLEQAFIESLAPDLQDRTDAGVLPAFHQAARYGDFRLLEAFLLADWDPDCPSFSSDPAEATALGCAVLSRLSETGEFDLSVPYSTRCAALLHRHGANLETGRPTPLATAALGTDTAMCRELMSWGASCQGAENSVPVNQRAKVREVLTWVAQTTADDDALF